MILSAGFCRFEGIHVHSDIEEEMLSKSSLHVIHRPSPLRSNSPTSLARAALSPAPASSLVNATLASACFTLPSPPRAPVLSSVDVVVGQQNSSADLQISAEQKEVVVPVPVDLAVVAVSTVNQLLNTDADDAGGSDDDMEDHDTELNMGAVFEHAYEYISLHSMPVGFSL